MSCMLSVGLRAGVGVLCGMIALASAAPVAADPKPLTQEEQAKVDKAIERGVRYLKRVQGPSGSFPIEFRGKVPDHFTYAMGHTLVPALALLECGVAPDKPSIQKVAKLVRKHASKLESTYELSLAILFLDRLGERQDDDIIRTLALRLVAGQSYTGGWSYRCPRLTAEQEADLLKALHALEDSIVPGKQPPGGEKRAAREQGADVQVPAKLAKLAVFQKPDNLFARKELRDQEHTTLYVGTTDNSNTQFAILGLWAAHRHDLPLVPTFRLVERRFECSQGDDGTWDYLYQFGGRRAVRPAYVADTGVGLLALAIGRVTVPADKEAQEKREKQIIRGLAALSYDIGGPTAQPNYYFLWTIERVAALYNLPTFGDKDWYRWGAAALVARQNTLGAWPHVPNPVVGSCTTGSWGTTLNTSFALLFLRRSNLVKDLTAKLPLKPAELNKGIMALTAGPTAKDTSSPGSAPPKPPPP